MNVFICNRCANSVCTVSFKGNGKPFICPKGNGNSGWIRLKKGETPITPAHEQKGE